MADPALVRVLDLMGLQEGLRIVQRLTQFQVQEPLGEQVVIEVHFLQLL